jgi:hypothetical protein
MGKHIILNLTQEQRQHPERLTRTGSAQARTKARARVLLLTDRGQGQRRTDRQVADAPGCSPNTVVITRRLYVREGPQAAPYDKVRPGAVPKITGEIRGQGHGPGLLRPARGARPLDAAPVGRQGRRTRLPSEIPTDQVGLGSVVTVRDDTDEDWEVTLVSPGEADPRRDKISDESPVGEALFGRKVGDTVSVTVPAGRTKYTVIAIRKLGDGIGRERQHGRPPRMGRPPASF